MSVVSDLIQEMVRDMLKRANERSEPEPQTNVLDNHADIHLRHQNSISLTCPPFLVQS